MEVFQEIQNTILIREGNCWRPFQLSIFNYVLLLINFNYVFLYIFIVIYNYVSIYLFYICFLPSGNGSLFDVSFVPIDV